MAEGRSRISGYLDGTDCRASIGCMRALGATIEADGSDLIVEGRALAEWAEPTAPLDCIRSGTTMRLLAGLLAGRPWFSVLTSDPQLSRRPMGRVVEPLRAMGARIDGRARALSTPGVRRCAPVSTMIAVLAPGSRASAGGTLCPGRTTLTSRSFAETRHAGGERALERRALHTLHGPVAIPPQDVRVPGDFSSAAFVIGAGLLAANDTVIIRDVGLNCTRTGLLDAIAAMGASVRCANVREEGGEPVGDLIVEAQPLKGAMIPAALVPRMIDESLCCFAGNPGEGETFSRREELASKRRSLARCGQLVRLGAQVRSGWMAFIAAPRVGGSEGIAAATSLA